MEAERESRQTCKCYITFSFGIKQSDITDVYGDRMKNLNSGNPPLKADGEQGDGNEPTAQHEKMSQKKYKFICLMRHIVYSAYFLAKIFEKVSFDPYNFRMTRLSARKSEQMKNF